MFEFVPRHLRWYRGRGCPKCHQTGYRRRLVLAELWTPGTDDIALINENAPADAMLEATRKNTYSLATDAMARLREGRTTLDEIVRVLPPAALRELHSIAS
jgi:type IV pilus assembly protein PilB